MSLPLVKHVVDRDLSNIYVRWALDGDSAVDDIPVTHRSLFTRYVTNILRVERI
jgi:hypothetical protein